MNHENKVAGDAEKQSQPTCNVNMTFNVMVGVVSIIVALIIGYAAYVY